VRHPYFAVPRPIVFGHRGASGEAPENTLVAFECALAQGAAILETDVQVTRDGKPVIAHDPEVSRTTEGHGRISELSLAELQGLDAGYRFSPDGGRSHPYRGRGIRVPTLREVFDALPEVRLNLELKQNDARLIEGVVQAVAECKRAELTLLAAAEDDTLAAVRGELRRQGVETAMGASVGDVLGFVRAAQGQGEPPPEPMALQIPPSFGGRPLVTPELVAFAHRHEVQVHVWTVNEEAEMERLLDLGVDGVMSDFPGRLRAVVDARLG
jgi:glycerophosphoryl diester phosphodiesterase